MGKIKFEDQYIYSKLKKYSKTKKGNIITDANYDFRDPKLERSRIIVHSPRYYLKYLKKKKEKLLKFKDQIPTEYPFNHYHNLVERIIANFDINILNIEYLINQVNPEVYFEKNKSLHDYLYHPIPKTLKNLFVTEWIELLKIIHNQTKVDINHKYLSYDFYDAQKYLDIKVSIDEKDIRLVQENFAHYQEFEGQYIKELIKNRMRNLGIPRRRYKFIFTEKHNLSVNSLRRSIRIPKIYHSNELNLKKTVAHEVQGHILRAYKSTRTKIDNSYFRINGLITSYEEFVIEEGIATFAENREINEYLSHYIANIKYYIRIIALLLTEKYPAHKVYEYLEDIKNFLDKSKILHKSKNATNILLHRVYRGFAISKPNFINNKIGIYLIGNRIVNQYFEEYNELTNLFESRRLNNKIIPILEMYNVK